MHPFFDTPRPHLFAHQGASGEAPSNTLPAFARAVELGIRYLETDCHPTRDGEIVLCHDETVDATTDGSGRICELTYVELCRLDAGYRFSADGRSHPFRGRGIRMPLLAELLRDFPDAFVNLEIKEGDQAVVDEVVRLVRAAGAEDRVLLASADPELMTRIRKTNTRTAIGSSTADVLSFYQAVATEGIAAFEPAGHALQIPTEFMGNELVTPEALAAVRELGLHLHVWTINEAEEMERLLVAGVDGVMSDFPGTLLEVARARAGAR